MNEVKKVLDNGYVRVVDWMGKEESIIEAARMSTSGSFVSWEPYEDHPRGDKGLLGYLWREGHHTPFEMCELLVEVQTPLFVAREWMRHRTFSYNELSARYVQMPDLHYVPSKDRMVRQGKHNKQDSSADKLPEATADGIIWGIQNEQEIVYRNYEDALELGLSKEVARVNTPVSRYTRFRVKGNLRNWLHFLKLRMASNAQYEIRVYAECIATEVKRLWPHTWALFEEWDLYGQRISRSQAEEYARLKTGYVV